MNQSVAHNLKNRDFARFFFSKGTIIKKFVIPLCSSSTKFVKFAEEKKPPKHIAITEGYH